MKYLPTLETERLIIRPITLDDLQDFYEKHYEVQASPAEIVTDAIFDMFIRTLHEQTQ